MPDLFGIHDFVGIGIPSLILAGYALLCVAWRKDFFSYYYFAYALASGGPVAAGPGFTGGPDAGGERELNIFNLVDRDTILDVIASASGGDAVINHISSRAQRVKKILW